MPAAKKVGAGPNMIERSWKPPVAESGSKQEAERRCERDQEVVVVSVTIHRL
jgi:hypothetical protein